MFYIILEVDLQMPDYLQRVSLHKPTYNISLPSSLYTTSESEMYRLSQKAQMEVSEQNKKLLSEVVLLKGMVRNLPCSYSYKYFLL
jgi:hypothetical protein